MGLLDRKKKAELTPETYEPGAADKLIHMLLDFGIDGAGPLGTADELAAKKLAAAGGDREKAIKKVSLDHVVMGGITGFTTGLGGFVTMPVALPVNVAAFYLQATRMVGAIASLRGHDVSDPAVRTAILLCLVGSDADEVLRKTGLATGTGMVAGAALRNLSPATLMIVNKALGFRLVRGLGERALTKLGRGVPLAGGAIGGTLDTWMMKKIADHAAKEFPPRTVPSTAPGTLNGSAGELRG